MIFLDRDKIYNRILDISSITDDVYVRELFTTHRYETVYVEKQGMILGIISPGDYYRYLCSGKNKSYINRKFTSLPDEDYNEAGKIFSRHSTIHEIPVIQNKILKGVISRDVSISDVEWNEIDISYVQGDKYNYAYHKLSVLDWLIKEDVDFYNVSYPNMSQLNLTIEDREVLYQRKKNGFHNMSEEWQKLFWKEDYYKGKLKDFCRDRNELSARYDNGFQMINDISNNNFTFKNGHRLLSNVSCRKNKRIFIIGRCNALGAFVSDSRTIGYYLQELINQNNLDYEVVVHANMGDFDLSPLYYEKVRKYDKIIFFTNDDDEIFYYYAANNGLKIKNINVLNAFQRLDNVMDNIFDTLFHHNHIVNKNVAEEVFSQLLFSDNIVDNNKERRSYSSCYIHYDVAKEIANMRKSYNVNVKDNMVYGGIVMNCNPFTYGHRYLIESALAQVDKLFVFVVQEDKSFFSFEDRFEMVKSGTADLMDRVIVLPSGKYIISNMTFSQYFDKENNVDNVSDMSYDVRIFGEIVSKEFNISKRFVGEEPTDIVTAEYNRIMNKILPEYNIDLIEVSRKKVDKYNVVSATEVRKCILEKNLNKIVKYVPSTTLDIITNKYWDR